MSICASILTGSLYAIFFTVLFKCLDMQIPLLQLPTMFSIVTYCTGCSLGAIGYMI